MWSGSLFRSPRRPFLAPSKIAPKVRDALAICDAPYSCRWSPCRDELAVELDHHLLLCAYSKNLIRMGNQRFLLSTIYAWRNVGIFENTRHAFSAISRLPEFRGVEDRCLQRSLLAAKTSKTFKQLGVLFIGAELSSGEMHAWIIESGEQPDSEDRTWINYRPLLALHS